MDLMALLGEGIVQGLVLGVVFGLLLKLATKAVKTFLLVFFLAVKGRSTSHRHRRLASVDQRCARLRGIVISKRLNWSRA